jgi:hypothetical protein
MSLSSWNLTELERAHKFCFKNEFSVKNSTLCGCFKCLAIYPSSLVSENDIYGESNGGKTVFCPYCRIDSVIGDKSNFPINTDFLTAMNSHYFLGDIG